MRYIENINGENGLTTRTILLAVAKDVVGDRGCNLEEMRNRIRLLDAIEAIPEEGKEYPLEDADYATMQRLIKAYKFGVVDRTLLQILIAITEEATKTPRAVEALKGGE